MYKDGWRGRWPGFEPGTTEMTEKHTTGPYSLPNKREKNLYYPNKLYPTRIKKKKRKKTQKNKKTGKKHKNKNERSWKDVKPKINKKNRTLFILDQRLVLTLPT